MHFTEFVNSQQTVLGDGGTMFELDQRGLIAPGEWIPRAVLESQQSVIQIHEEFANAGADILQAITYYAHRLKIETTSSHVDVIELNKHAVKLAHVAASNSRIKLKRDIFVAGGVSPVVFFQKQKNYDEIAQVFSEQIVAQMSAGVDCVFAETFNDIQEAIQAVRVCKKLDVPCIVTINGKESSIVSDFQQLVREEPFSIGLNCYHGPKETLRLIEYAKSRMTFPSHIHLCTQPVAYDIQQWDEHERFPLALDPLHITRQAAAQYAVSAQDLGVKIIGGCCGFRPREILEMCRVLNKNCANSQNYSRLEFSALTQIAQRKEQGYWDKFV
ncbi:hypothetical protein RCL1_002540 [Eukaryota sp. TZLM3-RCL]